MPVAVSRRVFLQKKTNFGSLPQVKFPNTTSSVSIMKKHCVALSQTGQFSQFFLDYIEGKEELKRFYSLPPAMGSFGEAIKRKSFPKAKRSILVQVLQKQYQGLDLSEAASNNLSALNRENTFTVTTGHQLNLFTGPLYFIYKIISTVNLAKKLREAYPESEFVPVYWMATEDHDFEEINYFKVDGKKFQWKTDQSGAVGDFQLDSGFRDFMKGLDFAPSVFKEAYLSSKTLSEAVRKYANALFGDDGLLVLDGNDPVLKEEFKEVILSDLFDNRPFEMARESTEELEKLGYTSQIFPREINLFYLEKGLRERIERTESGFGVVNTELRFSAEEMKNMVDTHPERFSPNVVLRPLYQEMILPNLAYLGGPAEVIYWLQLKQVFETFQVPFPVLLPRNFALIIDATIKQKLEKLNWTIGDMFQDLEQWKKVFVKKGASLDIDLIQERKVLESIFDKKGEESKVLEKSLCDAFGAGKVRALKILDQMSAKLRKAEERRQHVQLDRAKAIVNYIKPDGIPQERVVNMMQFYLENPELITDLLECFDPLDFRMVVLEYDS